MNTQNDRLLEYLKTHDGITQLVALNELGIFRLASRVNDLRKKGFDISGRMIFVRNRFGEEIRVKEYFLNI